MNEQFIHKFFRGTPPPNAFEGEKMYKPKKKKVTPRKRKPKTPPTRYYA